MCAKYALRLFSFVCILVALGLSFTFWPSAVLRAQIVQNNPGPPDFPSMGVALGQTLRLSVSVSPGPPDLPPSPCAVQISFFDTAGNAVGPSRALRLLPGQFGFLDFRGAVPFAIGFFGRRAQLRPLLTPLDGPDSASGCIATAEIFDDFTGADSYALNPGAPCPPPSVFTGLSCSPPPVAGSPPLNNIGTLGLVPGQTLRLSVSGDPGPPDTPPGPCVAQLSFADANGSPVGPASIVRVSNMQTAFLDLRPGLLGVSAFGQRMQVRPVLTPAPDGSLARCIAAAEVFDDFTGRTQAYLPAVQTLVQQTRVATTTGQ